MDLHRFAELATPFLDLRRFIVRLVRCLYGHPGLVHTGAFAHTDSWEARSTCKASTGIWVLGKRWKKSIQQTKPKQLYHHNKVLCNLWELINLQITSHDRFNHIASKGAKQSPLKLIILPYLWLLVVAVSITHISAMVSGVQTINKDAVLESWRRPVLEPRCICLAKSEKDKEKGIDSNINMMMFLFTQPNTCIEDEELCLLGSINLNPHVAKNPTCPGVPISQKWATFRS